MILLFILFPAIFALICLAFKSALVRNIMIIGATVHLLLTISTFFITFNSFYNGWLDINVVSKLFLLPLSILFFLVAIYNRYYMILTSRVTNYESQYCCCMLFMLGSMSLVILSRHLGLTWIAMEATTLFSAPLIYYHRSRAALEATWKYLLICSIGIALAMVGNIMLAYAYRDMQSPLLLENLLNAPPADVKWLKAAFIFFLVGYGTKMGLAPMHSWLPDAYSESPSPVSALFPALINCSFLVIMRVGFICNTAGLETFRNSLLILFAITSMAFAGIFIIGQKDYLKMLAFSSVGHAGLMVLGAGSGFFGIFGALLHMINHSMIKSMLFMISGNIFAIFRNRHVDKIGGMLQVAPATCVSWLVGFMAIAGLPPFGLFISQFYLCKGLLESHSIYLVAIVLFFIVVIFAGMVIIFIPTAIGTPPPGIALKPENPSVRKLLIPAGIAGIIALIMGIYIPSWLFKIIEESSIIMGGGHL